jgi:hypothetical protein
MKKSRRKGYIFVFKPNLPSAIYLEFWGSVLTRLYQHRVIIIHNKIVFWGSSMRIIEKVLPNLPKSRIPSTTKGKPRWVNKKRRSSTSLRTAFLLSGLRGKQTERDACPDDSN